MSNEINTTKFYRFLAGFESKGGWENVADSENGNGDGTVIKSEFRKFLNANWNGEENGELTNDLINSFWKKIDTNTSANKISGTKLKNLNALDKNEINNLDKKLEVYVQFDEFVKNNVKIPAALSSYGNQWKADVTEELEVILNQYINGALQGDLETLLAEALPTIQNKNTALYCAVEYQDSLKNGILADYPEYKVADDKTLESLINAYVADIDGEIDAESIKEEIRSIVDAYFATAELGEDSDYDLDSLGFNSENLNDIQKTVITAQIKTDLKEDAKNYEGFETEFDLAVEQFIEAKIKEGGDFDTLKNSASDFANSKYKTQLDNTVTINRTYKNIEEGSDFYNKLVAEFGETIAQAIAKNDRYIDAYKEAINEVATKVNTGEMTMDEVEEYVLKQISTNLEKFVTGGLNNLPIAELNTIYDKLATSAESQTDDDTACKQHREAAIKYCKALTEKGGDYKQLVTDAFGTDYTSKINEMYPAYIQEVMAELKLKALDVVDINNLSLSKWTGESELELTTNAEKSLALNATIMNGDKAYTKNIEYSVKDNAGLECSFIGNTLTIKTNDTVGIHTIKVVAKVDGKEIGDAFEIKVNVERSTENIISNVKSWDGEKSEHLEVCNLDGKNVQRDQLTTKNFAELYNSDAIIRLNSREGSTWGWDTVTERFTQLCDLINSALATSGLDRALLDKAADVVIAKYTNKDNAECYTKRSGSITNNTSDHIVNNRNTSGHRIVQGIDKDGTDEHASMVAFKDVVDDILEEYWKLV